jgi:hypothetical protein
MTLAVVGSTATFSQSNATTPQTPLIPDGSVDDVILFLAAWGYSAATSIANRPVLAGGISASAVHIGSVFGGGGTYGTNTGPRGFSMWIAEPTSTSGATDGTSLANVAAGVLGCLAIRISKDPTKDIETAFTGGADTTAVDAWAPTGFTDVGATAGDLLLHAQAAIPSTVNPTSAVAWPGTTLGTEANVRTANVATGGQVRCNLRSRLVSSGTSSGAPSAPAAATGLTGVHGIVRLREVDPPPPAGGWQVGSYAMGR